MLLTNSFQTKTTTKAKILSVGSYLPSQIVKSDDLFAEIKSDVLYDVPINWMSEVMGIKERRVSEPNCLPSDLAVPAAREAIDSCPGLNPDEIDMVIFCGIERDQPEPATAHTIQNALGLKAKHVFDVANACFGFIDGIEIANSFVKSGASRYALVVTGEVPTKLVPSFVRQLKGGVSKAEARNLIGWLSVGDAGGAVIVGHSAAGETSGFDVFNSNIDSSHINKCIYRHLPNGEIEGQMQMGRIVAAGFKLHKQIIGDTMRQAGWPKFDWLLTHQTGKRNFEQIADLKIVKKKNMVKSYDKLGNITSATFPVSFKQLAENKKVLPGSRIGGCFGGSGLATGQFCYTF